MKDGFIKIATAVPKVHLCSPMDNADEIISLAKHADEKHVKLLSFPELCITGYTCGDLFLQDVLKKAVISALTKIAEETKSLKLLFVVGSPIEYCGKLYNCAVFFSQGKIIAVIPKKNIPNYSEYYELRHFTPYTASEIKTIQLCNQQVPFGTRILVKSKHNSDFCVGAELCEDLWVPNSPSTYAALSGATIIVNLSAGDETVGKAAYRKALTKAQSAKLIACYMYCGAGNGESTSDMVFSGHSLIFENGKLLAEKKPFADYFELSPDERLNITETDVNKLSFDRQKTNSFIISDDFLSVYFDTIQEKTQLTRHISCTPFIPEDKDALKTAVHEILEIQAHGLAGRLKHINAKSCIIGISGGLDSTLALIACVNAAKLLGKNPDFVKAITMPCFGTSLHTKSNAQTLCEKLKCDLLTIDLGDSVSLHLKDISHDEKKRDVVYENAQARMRTLVLMDLANEYNGIVVGTGDLSELALGFATYNGDHMSMYGVNASIPKTLIQHIVALYANECADEELKDCLYDILNTPISPELLPPDPESGSMQQITESIVGPYELHDFFIYYTLRFGFSPSKIKRLATYAFSGKYSEQEVGKWLNIFIKRFFSQQFKRSCLPDGAKVGTVSFSPRGDFRMPSDALSFQWLNDNESE